MCASQSSSRDNSARAQGVDSPSQSVESGAARRALLERVLEETEKLLGTEDALDPQQMEAIREVARRHPGKGLVLEPVVVELVEAVVRVQFRGLAEGSPIWQEASCQIAQTLFDDPVARGRLEALWKNLSRE